MALSLVVSPEPLADRPRVRLDVTGTNVIPNAVGVNSLVDLYRTHADGRKYAVITEPDARLSAGSGIWYDYHAPFDQQVTYTVVIGTVEASAVDAAGYWNYAPAPNLLPSAVAGLGRSGDPLTNGWIVGDGVIVKSGDYLKAGGTGAFGTGYGAGANFQSAVFPLPVGLAPGAQYTFSVKIKNSAAGTYSPAIWLYWLNAASTPLATHVVETGHTWAANNEQTFTYTATVPANAAYYSGLFQWIFSPNAGSALIEAMMMQTGAVASAFPAAEFVPATSADTVLTSDETWLISPTSPDLSCKVHAVKGLSAPSQATQSGLQVIIGRKNPIAVTAGKRAGKRGSIIVRSDSAVLDQQIIDLLESDAPILINPQGGFERDQTWLWVQPGDVEGPINRAEYTGYEYREFNIPWTEVDQPEVYSTALWTWDDVTAAYATWADVTANYATWTDLQTDTRLT